MNVFKFFIVVFLCAITQTMYGQKTRKQLEAERNKLKKEINQVNKLLFETQKKQKSVLEDLKDINQKIDVRNKLISTINQESEVLTREISSQQRTYNRLLKKLEALKADYAEMIFKSYKSNSQQSRMMFVLSSENFYQAYKRLQYMKQYTQFRKKQGEEITLQSQLVKQVQDSLQYQKQIKDTLVAFELDQKAKIELDKKAQEKLVSQIKRRQSSYRAELRKKQAEERKVAARIDELIKEAIARSNANSKKKSTGFALTPEAKALALKFEENKGKLPWPVASGLVVRRFGKQPHPTLSGITIQSTGLHIVTDKNQKAESIFKGSVLAVQNLSDGRKSVLVQHGNYISAYNNLENIYVKKGDSVETGQALGTIFTDKVSGKTTLVFVLFKNTTRLNPSSWILPR